MLPKNKEKPLTVRLMELHKIHDCGIGERWIELNELFIAAWAKECFSESGETNFGKLVVAYDFHYNATFIFYLTETQFEKDKDNLFFNVEHGLWQEYPSLTNINASSDDQWFNKTQNWHSELFIGLERNPVRKKGQGDFYEPIIFNPSTFGSQSMFALRYITPMI